MLSIFNAYSKDKETESEYLGLTKPSLEQLFEEALQYGRPNLFCSTEKTFSANIEMWVNARNVTFEVKSGFGHKSAYAAIEAAVISARKALADLGAIK